jgi:antitoxin CptB|tara:strand:- start:52 stop:306 length:255 start_codon:yes stop_codon:yes gene_type:complete
MTNKEILKKQIIYRSTHRGTKEMDLLLGNFVKKNIGKFTDSELKDLENLLEIDDEILQKWFFGKNNENLVPLNKISKMFKEFKS